MSCGNDNRAKSEFSATLYSAILAYWFSTIPYTTSVEVFLVFVALDLVWFLAGFLARGWR